MCVFESIEEVLKIIINLWGGGIKLCNYFVPLPLKINEIH